VTSIPGLRDNDHWVVGTNFLSTNLKLKNFFCIYEFSVNIELTIANRGRSEGSQSTATFLGSGLGIHKVVRCTHHVILFLVKISLLLESNFPTQIMLNYQIQIPKFLWKKVVHQPWAQKAKHAIKACDIDWPTIMDDIISHECL
jgi:hypothetical protein